MRDSVTPYDTFGYVTHVPQQDEKGIVIAPRRESLPIIVRKFDAVRLALGVNHQQ